MERMGPKPARRFLTAADAWAELTHDEETEGWILSIDGAEQSHVDARNPRRVFYEYLRRIANVIDCAAPAGHPLKAVHLGGGAMTLPRYVAASRPGSRQLVVELARELPDFVLSHIPWPEGADVEVIHGDAREALPRVAQSRAVPANVVVLDVFAGADAPRHLRERAFYEQVRDTMAPGAVLLVNVGDDPGLKFFAEQVEVLGSPNRSGGEPVFSDLWCLTEQSMLTGRNPGNLILIARDRPVPDSWRDALVAAGPHPAAVLDRWALEDWVRALRKPRGPGH